MTIRDAIKSIAQSGEIRFFLITGKVQSVNEINCTCDVIPADGSPTLYDVRLRAIVDNEEEGFVVFPAINSDVVIGLLDQHNGVLLQSNKVEKIKVFGGKRGGMLYADKVMPLLEEINTKLYAIETILKGAPVPEAGNGSPSGLQTALKTALQTAVKQPLNGFVNEKFLQ